MPLTGTRDISSLASRLPVVDRLDTEPWELKACTHLQLMFEIDDGAMTSLLPPALHPTIPPTVLFNVLDVPESSVGPFTLAEVRIGCRSGARPRGLLVAAVCNSETAISELARRWGYPVRAGDVELSRYYDRITAEASIDGEPILSGELIDPEAISGSDIQYLANLNLARIERNGEQLTRLIQVDPDYVFHRADRGRPQLEWFDPDAWDLPDCEPVYPVSASCSVVDVTLPRIRYLVDPAKPPLQSVEKL